MIAAAPGDTGVTIPDEAPTVATPGAVVLVHVPPAEGLAKVMVMPTQVGMLPVIAGGKGFTVTTLLVKQPTPSVYVTVAVPGTIPETNPPASIVAAVLPDMFQVPPPVDVLNNVVPSTQTFADPVMAPGNA